MRKPKDAPRRGSAKRIAAANSPAALAPAALAPAALAAAALAAPGAAAAGERRSLDIPAGRLDAALLALAQQTEHQLLYSPEAVAGRRAPAVRGRYTAEEALRRLLAASDVVASRAGPNVIVIKAAGAQPSQAAPAAREDSRPFAAEPRAADGAAPAPAAGPAATVAEVLVTGTHLRGVGDTPSPVLTLDRAELERSGHATLAAALSALPQNFPAVTEGGVTTGADRSSSNNTYGTGLNLRGLGADATLVLINGRRMAGAGAKGDFADVSAIPAAAVERVEILLDGASALYGSDAVGGVVNVILRRDYAGAETRLTAGGATAGEPREVQLGQTVGGRWPGGGGLLAYELHRREALPASARRFTASADLRPLGGTDHRRVYASPGNIMRFDPATGANVPGWAIPPGQDGTDLAPEDFIAGAANLGNQNAGLDLLPRQTRHSVYAAVRQAISGRLSLSGDARLSHRRFEVATGWPFALLNVNGANPWFVSPVGASSHQIAYSFDNDLPRGELQGSAESLGATLGADLKLGRGWHAEGYGAFAQEIGETRAFGLLNASFLNEALGRVADNPATPFSAARDGYLNPFGAGGNNSPAVLAFISSGFSASRTRNRVWTANLQADGPLFALPGGAARLALGAHARREAFFRTGSNFLSGTSPRSLSAVDARRELAAAFAELRVPVFGPANARPGLRRLELSLAGRLERYDDFGRTANPKLGALWSPMEGLLARVSYGTSFRAPALRELRDQEVYSPSLLPAPGGGRVLSLVQTGGNPELEPETAASWTAGLEFAPPDVPGLRLSAGWFEVRFEDRIGRPAQEALGTALSDPTLARFVSRISPATDPQDRARIEALLASPALNTSQGSFPPEAYGAIVDARYVNTAAMRVQGLDLQAQWRPGEGELQLGANASYLLDYEQQLTPDSPRTERAGLAGFPIRLRARAFLDWTRGPYGALLAVNYAGHARDLEGARIRAHATVDLQGRWTAPAGSPVEGLRAVLTVRNLLDRDPPFHDAPAGFGFDAANADPIGRFVSLQLTRAW